MQTYAQYCPIVRAVEILGDRWTLLILRDMLTGSRRFNELVRGLPGISRALLARRLRQLVDAGLVERSHDGYDLTSAGEDIRPLVFGLAEWGARHAFGDPRPEELDPEVLMWWLQGRVDTSDVTERAVVQIEVTDEHRYFWLVVEPQDASVCYADPGFDVDAVLKASLRALYRIWMGEIDLLDAVRRGDAELTGERAVVRSFPQWLQLSPVASYVQAAHAARPSR